MVSKLISTVIVLASLASSTAAQSVGLPVNGNQVPVADVNNPQTTPTSQGEDFKIAEPDQTFTGDKAGGHGKLGLADGVPEDEVTYNPEGTQHVVEATTAGAGKRRSLLGNRRLLQGTLDLSGDGVSAGDSEAGVAAKAFGHGTSSDNELDQQGTHIQPHGADVTATQGGQDTTVGGEANPDCVGTIKGFDEGPACAGVTGK
ncbi:hypothetical protein WJX74_000812 [Apatococcus lobatus]|uniref:Uncharacterized protein n=1 Tax=Apatococcus lobatus TaxID=904363 RepID=A0AAW1RXW0_9CHLO